MSEMVERLAKVLSPQSWQALGTACDTRAKKKRREASLDYARRCIVAMRKPTKEMIDAFYIDHYGDAEKAWQAMIDKVLE